MKITVRPEKGWGRATFKIPDEVFEDIKALCARYKFRIDEALRIILVHGYIEKSPQVSEGEFASLERQIEALKGRLYELEGKWSPLKFRTYYLAMDNQNLAIQLSGMLAENRRLRERLGLPPQEHPEVEEKIHYYLNFGEKANPEGGPSELRPRRTQGASRGEQSSGRRSV